MRYSVLPISVLVYCSRLMSNNKDLLTYLLTYTEIGNFIRSYRDMWKEAVSHTAHGCCVWKVCRWYSSAYWKQWRRCFRSVFLYCSLSSSSRSLESSSTVERSTQRVVTAKQVSQYINQSCLSLKCLFSPVTEIWKTSQNVENGVVWGG